MLQTDIQASKAQLDLSDQVLLEHKKLIDKLCKDIANTTRGSLRNYVCADSIPGITNKFIPQTYSSYVLYKMVPLRPSFHSKTMSRVFGLTINSNLSLLSRTYRKISNIVLLNW